MFSKNLKKKAILYSLYSFSLLIPLNQRISTIALLFWLIISIILVKPSKINSNKTLLILPALYFIYVLSLIYSDNFSFKFFEQKASLVVFPLIFYLNGYSYNTKTINKAITFFVMGCFISLLCCFVVATYHSINFNEAGFDFKTQVLDNEILVDSSIYGGNYFFGSWFSVFHQNTYLAMYLCFAIHCLLSNPNIVPKLKHKAALTLFFCLGLFLLSSKAGLLILILILFFHILKTIKSKIILTSSLLIFLSLASLFLILNPRTKEAISNFYNRGITFHPEDNDSMSLRLMTWESSLKIIAENPVFGVGVGDAYSALREKYKSKRYIVPYRLRLNAHNQYFQILVECGFLGLLLLFSHIFLLITKKHDSVHIKNLSFGFLVIIIINFLFESILNKYSGLSFYTFFLCLFLIKNRPKVKVY